MRKTSLSRSVRIAQIDARVQGSIRPVRLHDAGGFRTRLVGWAHPDGRFETADRRVLDALIAKIGSGQLSVVERRNVLAAIRFLGVGETA